MFRVGDIVKIKDDSKPYLPDRCNHNRSMKIIDIINNKYYFDDESMISEFFGYQNGMHPAHLEYDIKCMRKQKIKRICLE